MSFSPVNTALLSYGMSGEVFHAPLLKAHPGFDLSVIVERTSEKAAARFPHIKVCRTAEEALQDNAVELVVINTPNATHHRYAKMALEADKHVIVEKPFTITAAEADELIDVASRRNLMLSVFQNRRWDGDFLTLQKVVKEGRVGRVTEFEAHYDRYRDYVEEHTWKEEKASGSGILYNLGSHMLDQALILFGWPLEADARIGVQRTGGKVDDFYDIRLQYKDFLAIIKSSYLVKQPGPRYILHGTKGSFMKYGIDPQEQALKEGQVPGTKDWGKEDPELWGKLYTDHAGEVETIPGNYLYFYQNIFEVIREKKELIVKPQQAREVIRLIQACYESNHSRKAVTL